MIGITYLLEEDAKNIRDKIRAAIESGRHDEEFWEIVLYRAGKMVIPAKVIHASDIVEINTYEQLRELDGGSSVYRDYQKTKENVFSLNGFIEAQPKDWCLTHIDAVPDNFLFYRAAGDGGAEERIDEALQLTDWEYAGMQDPQDRTG